MHLAHENVHELLAFVVREAALAQADVERVGQKLLVVRAKVDGDGEGLCSGTREAGRGRSARAGKRKGQHERERERPRETHRLGVDAARGDIERQLALRNAHAADAEVAETQDARTVRHDLLRGAPPAVSFGALVHARDRNWPGTRAHRDLHLVMRHGRLKALDDLAEVGQVGVVQVQRADRLVVGGRRRVDEGPVLAREADDGRTERGRWEKGQLVGRDEGKMRSGGRNTLDDGLRGV